MEKRLQLWSPVWGWLATKEGESVDLKGQDLVLYETAIQEALEQEKLYYRKKSAPFNLMDYYDADDSVKEKVQNLDIQVKKRTRWFVCLCQPCINRASYTAGTGSDPELSQQAVRRGNF